MKSLRHVFTFACLVSTAALCACVDRAAPGDDGEPIGEGQSAIHESACGTDTTAHDYTPVSGFIGYCSGPAVITSPDAAYGDSACTHAFIVQYTTNQTNKFPVSAQWSGPALTAANCANAVLQLDTYDGTGAWQATVNVAGTWVSSQISMCMFNPPSGWPTLPSGVNSRVVASAGWGSCAGKTCTYSSYVPVTISVIQPQC